MTNDDHRGRLLREAFNQEIYDEGVYRDGPDSNPIMWWDFADAAMRVIARARNNQELRASILEVMDHPVRVEA